MSGPALNAAHADMLRHMLGINDPAVGRPKPYRNHAAVTPGDPLFVELAELGLVERYHAVGDGGSAYDYFRCTEAGRSAAMASHRACRWPRPRRRYHRFLALGDVFPDLTFREFLTDPMFADVRRTA